MNNDYLSSMPYQKISQAINGLDVLAKTVAVPREHKALRVPSFPALERTGVLSFTDTNTYAVPATLKGYAMVCRNAAFPVWVTQVPSTTSFSFYTVVNDNTAVVLLTGGEYNSIGSGPIGNVWTNSLGFLSGAAYTMPLLRYENELYFYNVTGYVGIQARCLAAPGISIANIDFAFIDSKMNVVTKEIRFDLTVSGTEMSGWGILPAGVVGFRVNAISLYVANGTNLLDFGYGVTTSTSLGVSILSNPTGVCASVLFPSVGPTEAFTTTAPWKATRATAVGALFSNVTAAQYKEGTVSAARVNSESVNVLSPSTWEASIAKVYPKDRYFGPLENGLYTFTLPDEGSEKYVDYLPMQTGALMGPNWVSGSMIQTNAAIFDLDNISYANLVVFTDIENSATILAVTVDRHIEFRSSSVLFPLGFSSVALESYHAAQMALVQMGVFFENPLHLGLITSMVANAVRSVAPYVMPAVRTVGRAALTAATDKIVEMANKKIGNMTKQKQMTVPMNKTVRKVGKKKPKKR